MALLGEFDAEAADTVHGVRRLLTGLMAMTLAVAAGCGGSPPESPEAKRTPDARDKACAAGKGNLEIADALPSVPGDLEVVEADPEFMEPVVGPMRQAMGERLRDIETRAVVPKGMSSGTGLVLANFSEGSGPPGDVIRAARDAAKENDELEYEEISVAGARGVLIEHSSGDVQVSAPLGDCAMALMFDTDRERILTVAKALRAPG